MAVTGRLILLALFPGLVLIASDGTARTGDLGKDPTHLVKVYLSLDSRGARLDSMSLETLKPYVNWKEEPAWGHVVVVESYEVVDDIKRWEVVSNMEVLIPVEFQALGRVYWNTAGFVSEKRIEQVKFRVKAVNSRWKIMEPMLPPHVSLKRLVNHVREAALEEANPVRRRTLEALADDLRKARS